MCAGVCATMIKIRRSSSSPLLCLFYVCCKTRCHHSCGVLFACKRSSMTYVTHVAPQMVVLFTAARYDTASVPTGGLSRDLVAHANALQLPRQNTVMSFCMQEMTSSLISDPNSLVVGSSRWKMRRRPSGGERGLLAELSGIPAGLGRGSSDSICGA